MRSSAAAPVTVSPGRGRRSTLATRSRLTEPTTVSSVLCRKRAEVDRGPREVLAQVEEAGPAPPARSPPGRPHDAVPPPGHRRWMEPHRRGPSALVGGRTRGPQPRRRRAGPRAAVPSSIPRRDPRARRPTPALWRESWTSDFYYHRENHRPPAGSVVDQLPHLVVEVLLQE